MADVVVTVPKTRWADWLMEGDLPGDAWSGNWSFFKVPTEPKIAPGERVYIVAYGRLRGYALLVGILCSFKDERGPFLVRAGDAVAVTIPQIIRGFQGVRYRWWPRESEQSFKEWRKP